MSDQSILMFACFLLTAGTLFYIFYLPNTVSLGAVKTRLSYLRERREAVYDNLRDLNFEYKAGKVPDADYASMKLSLEEEAAAILSEISKLESAPASS